MALVRITDLLQAGSLSGDELIEISQLSSTVTITATTISAQASDNSYNDSGAGFISAGFSVGDRVRVEGFTGNIANNILSAVVTDVTASKLTIGGSDGDVIVDDVAGESVKISKWVSRKTTLDLVSDLSSSPIEHMTIALSDLTSALTAGTGKEVIRMPYAFTLTEVRAYLAGAQTSGSIVTVDINENGSSILSTKLTIDNGEKTSETALTAAVISDPSLADDSEITFDIDQVGTGGAGLKVVLIGYRT